MLVVIQISRKTRGFLKIIIILYSTLKTLQTSYIWRFFFFIVKKQSHLLALDLFRFHIVVWNPSEIVVIITDSSPSVLVNYSDSQIFSNWILQWLRYFGPNILFFYFFRSQKPKKKKRQQTKARPLSLCCCSHWRWFHYRRWCCAAVFSLLLNACVRLSACFFFLLCNIKHRNLREAADSTSSEDEVGSHLSVTHPWRGDQIRQRRDIIFFFFWIPFPSCKSVCTQLCLAPEN